jgi:putative endonuclease
MKNGYYFCYILLCVDGTYYTGMTNDLERRFAEHETGYDENSYTFSRRPVELMWAERYSWPRDAYAAERKIKKWSVKKKKALIEERFDDLKNYARCLNETSHLYWREKLQQEMKKSS